MVVSLIISALLGIVLIVFVVEFLFNQKMFRKTIDGLAKYEGYWFLDLTINDNRGFSLFHFHYDSQTKSYEFSGTDYDEKGNIVCACTFCDIRTSKAKGFLYTGNVNKGKVVFTNMGEFIYRDEERGHGTFYNINNDETIQGDYIAHKITKEKIVKLIGKSKVVGSDYDELARLFCKELRKVQDERTGK